MEKSSKISTAIFDLITSIQNELSKRPWDWQAAVLTVVLVQIAASRLKITEWVPSLGVVVTLSFIAVTLGLVIGFSSFTRRQTFWIGIEYGLLLIPMQLLTAIERTDSLYLDLRKLLIRLFESLIIFAQNQPVFDTLFFVTLCSLGFWMIGLFTGYQLARHRNFLKIVIPPGLVMMMIQIYDSWVPFRAWGLAVYIIFTLILLGRLNFLNNKTNWKTKHVFLTSDAEWDISRSALTFAAIAVFIAWALPGALTSIIPIAAAWNDFTKPISERLSAAVSALDSPYGISPSGDFYGSSLSLGSSAPVSDTTVFFVRVDQVKLAPVRYYWRGRGYDQYVNGQWSSTSEIRRTFNPELDVLQTIDLYAQNEARFTVTTNFPKQELLYGPAETVWVNRDSKLLSLPVTDSTRDVIAWLANPGLTAGDSYQVRAMIVNPSIEELRAAESVYPKWVSDRYLQIPPEIEPPLKELAERITKGYWNPYDKAQAITSFLRNEIEYTTELTEKPPSSEDPLIWVLFEYKKGFCIYSASAEVLMLRSLGIPARMAVGFAEGQFDSQRDRYTVARFNSHAWPEVYFPDIGWVEFEPTGNQDPLNRPHRPYEEPSNGISTTNPLIYKNNNEAQPELSGNDSTLREGEDISTPTTSSIVMRYLYVTLMIGVVAMMIFLIQRYSMIDRVPVYLAGRYTRSGNTPPFWLDRWLRWTTLSPMERTFQSINLSLYWLASTQPAYKTSQERSEILIKRAPSIKKEVLSLLKEYQKTLYSPRSGNLIKARRAAFSILIKTWQIRIKEALQFLDYRYNRIR